MEYHKIETLFERDDKFVVDPSRLKKSVIGTIREWDVTEKVDGTNIRIMLAEDGTLRIGGRTDNAQMPGDLAMYLMNTFSAERLKAALWLDGQPTAAVLYGEGYGSGIQKGGYYRASKAFRLFDVLIGGKWWLDWKDVCGVALKLGIKTVPYLGRWTLDEIVERVREGIQSTVADEENPVVGRYPAEGIVARPVETLFDKKGARVIIKLKTKDFGHSKMTRTGVNHPASVA